MEESEYCDRLGVIYRGELIALGTPRALKTEYMQEVVLEIECERPNLAMELVERLPEIKEAALFGKGLHAVTRDPNAAPAIQSVRSALASAGFRTTKIESIVPTLEDVFVSLIEARDRAEAPQAEVPR
jgi:ABC-2 type transport system ATP-binding protein